MGVAPTLDILLNADQIRDKVQHLATEIAREFQNKPIVLVVVLKGAFVFAADLARALPMTARVEFVRASSYGSMTTPQAEVTVGALSGTVNGEHVLIVEDIFDSGATLSRLKGHLEAAGCRSVRSVALLSKSRARGNDRNADFVGFEIPDAFVVGYGLDFAEQYRSLPYVAVLRES